MGKAVVVGGTGAVGRELVGVLLTNGHWERVVTVGRREVAVPESFAPSGFKAQLEQVVVNMDNLEAEAAGAFSGAEDVFCALGTIRKVAGSAEEFVKVDYEYVAKTARAAKAAGAQHFSLVSAPGANAHLWAGKASIFQGLLYSQTKGRAEEVVRAQGFPAVSIYRPGLLLRGDLTRANESTTARFLPGFLKIEAAEVARCMVQVAVARGSLSGKPPAAVYTNKAMLAAAKAGTFLPAAEAMK